MMERADNQVQVDRTLALEHDTVQYWRQALRQNGDYLVTGLGAAGPIRCTRSYGRHRLDLVRETAREARAEARRRN